MKPYRIFIGGRELERYTSSTLKRSKEKLTGELTVEIFFGYVPDSPQVVEAVRGVEILVYVMNQLAFTGFVDKRSGKGKSAGRARDAQGRFTSGPGVNDTGVTEGIQTSFGADGYSVTLTARGKTKYLIDSSHRHPTCNIKNTSDRKVIEELIKEHEIELDWQATEVPAELIRLRDGTRIVTEIFSQCNENCHFVYETRDGKLRVTDTPSQAVGSDIILGQNILSFSAEQSEDRANSEVTIKGHRRNRGTWGRDAIIPTVETVKDSWVGANIPLNIQHYGDATPEALQRRGKFEADRRAAESKRVTTEMFHLGSDGQPWDIGTLHYVEIPPEGVFDVMECVELTYNVSGDSLTTSLTLAPAPSAGVTGGASGAGNGLMSPIGNNALQDLVNIGASRRVAAGITIAPGLYPSAWSGAALSAIANPVIAVTSAVNALLQPVTEERRRSPPPLTLPDD